MGSHFPMFFPGSPVSRRECGAPSPFPGTSRPVVPLPPLPGAGGPGKPGWLFREYCRIALFEYTSSAGDRYPSRAGQSCESAIEPTGPLFESPGRTWRFSGTGEIPGLFRKCVHLNNSAPLCTFKKILTNQILQVILWIIIRAYGA